MTETPNMSNKKCFTNKMIWIKSSYLPLWCIFTCGKVDKRGECRWCQSGYSRAFTWISLHQQMMAVLVSWNFSCLEPFWTSAWQQECGSSVRILETSACNSLSMSKTCKDLNMCPNKKCWHCSEVQRGNRFHHISIREGALVVIIKHFYLYRTFLNTQRHFTRRVKATLKTSWKKKQL